MKPNQFLIPKKIQQKNLERALSGSLKSKPPSNLQRNLQRIKQRIKQGITQRITQRIKPGGQKNLIFLWRQIQQQAFRSFLSLFVFSLALGSCSWITNPDPNLNRGAGEEAADRLDQASQGNEGGVVAPETGPPKLSPEQKQALRKYYSDNCIEDVSFTSDSEKDHLFGTRCFAGKQLVIETLEIGERVDTFSSDAVRLGSASNETEGETSPTEAEGGTSPTEAEGGTSPTEAKEEASLQNSVRVSLDFIRPVYKVGYKILDAESNTQNNSFGFDVPLLQSFLSETEDLYGSKNTKYHILFVLKDNYIVLYKASKDKNDIPYTERTSLEKLTRKYETSTIDGKTRGRLYWVSSPYEETPAVSGASGSSNGSSSSKESKEEGVLYGVPWLGWRASFCNIRRARTSTGEMLSRFERDNCSSTPTASGYTNVNITRDKNEYKFASDKKDLFPSHFFDGIWFYGAATSSSANIDDEVSPSPSYLVKTDRKPEKLEFIDQSGSDIIEEQYRETMNRPIKKLDVKWKKYKMKTTGNRIESFSEEEDTDTDDTKRPYLQIDFAPLRQANVSIEEIIVEKDLFSIVLSGMNRTGLTSKVKKSFLRASSVNQTGMEQRRWFWQDHQHLFGIFSSEPRVIREGTENQAQREQHYRMIRFNTHADKEIKWYFSKTSPKGEYRELARRAVAIYNDAFQHISGGQIKVTVGSNEEDKDHGDFRYNIIHLIDRRDQYGRGLLGRAPSFFNPDTGQIIGASCSVNIAETLKEYHKHIKRYIRARLFYPDRLNPASLYLQSQIEDQCEEVTQFINNPQIIEGAIATKPSDKLDDEEVTQFINNPQIIEGAIATKPSDPLNDEDIYKACANKISKDAILSLILHEMGHNFALSHNFKASADKDNYYRSVQEMEELFPSQKGKITLATVGNNNKELPKSSSVMDYVPFLLTPVLTVLGKYDLAALRFLYMNQIEKSDGTFELLASNEDDQQSLYDKISSSDGRKEYKTYFHCSDEVADNPKEDYLCLLWDHGSTPLSIVKNERENILRKLNGLKYRYDDDFKMQIRQIAQQGLQESVISTFDIIKSFYNFSVNNYFNLSAHFLSQWLKLKTDYLNSQANTLNETVSMYNIWESGSAQSEKYQQAVQGGLSKPYETYILKNNCLIDSETTEFESSCAEEHVKAYKSAVRDGSVSDEQNKYDLLYEFRNWLKQSFFRDWIRESMRCQIEHRSSGRIEWINLEIIRESIKNHYQQSLYIEDCESPTITKFLEKDDLHVVAQKGMENFKFYDELAYKENDSGRWDVLPYSSINNISPIVQPVQQKVNGEIRVVGLATKVFAREPDFLSEFKNRMESWYFNEVGQAEDDFTKIANEINNFVGVIQNVETSTEENGQIQAENLNYFLIYRYRLQPGYSDSFDQKFTYQFLQGATINTITDSPYLIEEVYKNFKEKCPASSSQPKCTNFKSYLMAEEEELVVTFLKSGVEFIYFPHQRGSLAEKRIQKFKELKRKAQADNSDLPQVFIDLINRSIQEKLKILL